MFWQKITYRLLAVGVLLVFGFLKLPVETGLREAQQKAGFRPTQLNLEMRENLGQSGFIAALGGYRALVANLLWIQAYTEWEKTHWEKMRFLFNTIVTLQPRSTLYWTESAWHMAFNASVAQRRNPEIQIEALRRQREKYYWDVGRDFLERGIQNNPDDWRIHEQLGFLLREKYKDHCAAAEAYLAASRQEEALGYTRRAALYEMAKCPGREREAYERLLKLYHEDEKNHVPTLLRLIKDFEEQFDIPADQRIPDLDEAGADAG